MGFYIEVPQRFNKAEQIIKLYGGRILDKAPNFEDASPDEAIICVFHNQNFDAAGFAYNPRELEYFKQPDKYQPNRKRTWLIINRKKACLLTGYTES